MNNWFNITNENVQLWTLYTTVLIALVGFVFNAISLWQTKKATEDMAKPYVNFYIDTIAIKDSEMFFVIKNFGQTPAYITGITFDGTLDRFNRYQFQSLVGNMLAPGQKLTSTIQNDSKIRGTIMISYKDSHNKTYSDKFTYDTDMMSDLAYTVKEHNKSDKEPSAIRQSTMALMKHLR